MSVCYNYCGDGNIQLKSNLSEFYTTWQEFSAPVGILRRIKEKASRFNAERVSKFVDHDLLSLTQSDLTTFNWVNHRLCQPAIVTGRIYIGAPLFSIVWTDGRLSH